MPTYRYEARNAAGKVTAGTLQAADLAAASAQVRARASTSST
jgi:type II secretory pathway component PulF